MTQGPQLQLLFSEVGVDGLINFDGLISMEFPIAVANYHLPPDFCHTSLLVSVTEYLFGLLILFVNRETAMLSNLCLYLHLHLSWIEWGVGFG